MKRLLMVALFSFAVMPGLALLANGEAVEACAATSCESGTGCYSQGKCLAGQRCSMDGNTPTWVDDESCPPLMEG